MEGIATIIASEVRKGDIGQDGNNVSRFERIVDALKERPFYRNIRILSAGRAAEFHFLSDDFSQVTDEALSIIADAPVDLIIQKRTLQQRKTLLIADMDSTIICQESMDELADYVGLGAEISKITAQAMQGEIDFATAFKLRVSRLAGCSRSLLAKILQERINIRKDAFSLVATMAANGSHCVLLSGGLMDFAVPIGRQIGFHEIYANHLEYDDEKLTGKVKGRIIGQRQKRELMENIALEHGCDLAGCLAVGDGANDIDMITKAGLGVGIHAKPALASQADANITHTGLRSLLYLQGFDDAQIIDPRPDPQS